jgi:hypothetical protein
MNTSTSIGKIAPAFLKAQMSMGAAKKGESNPYFKSKYADLSSVLEACKDALNANGISILQPHVTEFNPTTGDEVHFVETRLVHESGEFISSRTKIVVSKQNDPQSLGSSISYARRYGLQSLISLPAEDDDAEKAMGRGSFAKKEAPQASTATRPSGQKFRKKKEEVSDEI